MLLAALELEKIIEQYAPLLSAVDEADLVLKPSPEKWSKKEILGHLIDSAQNNIRRFIVAQYEDKPHIVYAQDFWVTASRYQDYNTKDLVDLWHLINKHACNILKNIPDGVEQRICITRTDHTIEWLALDYNKHLLHHLYQVLNLEPIPYP